MHILQIVVSSVENYDDSLQQIVAAVGDVHREGFSDTCTHDIILNRHCRIRKTDKPVFVGSFRDDKS